MFLSLTDLKWPLQGYLINLYSLHNPPGSRLLAARYSDGLVLMRQLLVLRPATKLDVLRDLRLHRVFTANVPPYYEKTLPANLRRFIVPFSVVYSASSGCTEYSTVSNLHDASSKMGMETWGPAGQGQFEERWEHTRAIQTNRIVQNLGGQ
ncbi:hypothetical protein BJX66DRAFT_247662 [Aspergillus keveii]|uniref:Uncharacterized protein n=1 Tax=Aspergillus keveii TaxID=714993 RepID=A0ABR4G0G2_9EURO